MATITVRLSDDTRDALQAKADAERQTLSDFVRSRLEDAVFVYADRPKGDVAFKPESLDPMQRHTLALLHRILARVLPADSAETDGDTDYQLERAKVLERGFTGEYSTEFAGLREELTPRQCEFVMDVLDMFRIALYSINQLREDGAEVDNTLREDLTFRGFDHNDPLEYQMSEYVRYLVKNEKWEEQAEFVLGRERGNSHHLTAETYSRMLTAYREVKQSRPRSYARNSYLLSADELRLIAEARIHPSRR